ncbi:hypothetical protein RchiOBHm_Chr6g0273221 [Rosa chinensis]|uniref:Uncharacterized protein n=1 Tax=Rosa chinensis TaxID=74649 RepID=A0A2P6PRH0_ROSCH|nr:hypothetical protein RchiOBHm_Chr6g0273221 [Rosa chinensis]
MPPSFFAASATIPFLIILQQPNRRQLDECHGCKLGSRVDFARSSSRRRETESEARPKQRTRTLLMVDLMIESNQSTSCFFVNVVNR